MKVSFSPAAQGDLLDIAVYIAQDNPARAATFVEELEAKCMLLGAASGIGTAASSWAVFDLLSRTRKPVAH
jgi:toxin ParE1/3/4